MQTHDATPKTMRGRADFSMRDDLPQVEEITMEEYLSYTLAGAKLVPLAYEDLPAEVVTLTTGAEDTPC